MPKRKNVEIPKVSELNERNEESTEAKKKVRKDINENAKQQDFQDLMKPLLENFATEINAALVTKKRILEQYVEAVFIRITQRIMKITKRQISEKRESSKNFRKQLSDFLQESETEVKKTKKFLEKTTDQNQSMFQQEMNQRQAKEMRNFRRILENFYQVNQITNTKHQQQFSNLRAQLRSEMDSIQTNFHSDIFEGELDTLQESLKSSDGYGKSKRLSKT